MKHLSEKLYLSTIDSHASKLAQEYGTGIELCQFCYAPHMDELFETQQADVEQCMKCAERFILHAPFSELSPASVDPLVLEIVKRRFRQAARLAQKYGVNRMVVHSGYIPNVYYKSWFIERSVIFWQDFLRELPNDFELLYENVMDDEPQTLIEVANGVQDERFGFCMDVGHLNILSENTACEWARAYGTRLKHVHLHNNYGIHDDHAALYDGSLDIPAILHTVEQCAPNATVTLELQDAEPSLKWLKEKGLL